MVDSEAKMFRFYLDDPVLNHKRDAVAKLNEFSTQSTHSSILRLVLTARSRVDVFHPGEFCVAKYIPRKIRRTSNDFALYRNKNELARFVEMLSGSTSIFDEILR